MQKNIVLLFLIILTAFCTSCICQDPVENSISREIYGIWRIDVEKTLANFAVFGKPPHLDQDYLSPQELAEMQMVFSEDGYEVIYSDSIFKGMLDLETLSDRSFLLYMNNSGSNHNYDVKALIKQDFLRPAHDNLRYIEFGYESPDLMRSYSLKFTDDSAFIKLFDRLIWRKEKREIDKWEKSNGSEVPSDHQEKK